MVKSYFSSFLILVVFVLFETALLSNIFFLPAIPDFLLLCVLYFSIRNGKVAGEVTGFVSGLLYARFRKRGILSIILSLVIAMIAGRLVWGAAEIVLLGIRGNAFTWQAFLAGAVLNAIPGIVLQLVLIPAILFALHKAKLVRFRNP